jgi:hypothetical protein
MEMALDQARQNQAAGDVEHPRTRRRLGSAERRDPALLDQKVGAAQDGRLGIQGEQGAALEEQGRSGGRRKHGGFLQDHENRNPITPRS